MKHFAILRPSLPLQRWSEKHPVLPSELLHTYRRHHCCFCSLKQVLTQNHRVIQTERDIRRSVVHPPAQSKVRPGCLQLSGGSWQGWRHHSHSINLLHCLAVPIVKNNSLALPLRSPLCRYWGLLRRAPKPSLLKAELEPALQPSPCRASASAPDLLSGICWTHSSLPISFLYCSRRTLDAVPRYDVDCWAKGDNPCPPLAL